MRVLIVIAHEDPSSSSASHRIAKVTEKSLLESGNEVRVVDLLKSGFDKIPNHKPVSFEGSSANANEPEVIEQQENLLWCSHYILIGPIWFYRLPSIFYAYFERVFTIGFACEPGKINEDGLLKGRKAMMVVTCGGGDEEYAIDGEIGSVESLLFPITFGHLRYCGFTVLRTQAFYDCLPMKDEENRLNKWSSIVKNLDSRPVLPVHPATPNGKNNLQMISAMTDYPLE